MDEHDKVVDETRDEHLIELFQCTREQYDNRDQLTPKPLVSNTADSQ